MQDSDDGSNGKRRADRLLELAVRKFGNLRPVEEELFRCAATGKQANYTDEEDPMDPALAEQWGPERAMQADRIAWLCTEREAASLVGHRGVRVAGLCLESLLDLDFARINFPLVLENCSVREGIGLRSAELRTLHLVGSYCGALVGEGVTLHGDLILAEGFHAVDRVGLKSALIEGDIDCSGGRFHGGEPTLCVESATVRGDVLCESGFRCHGGASFTGSQIGGVFACKGGDFSSDNGPALRVDQARIRRGVRLHHGFHATGTVSLRGASLGGDLDCRNARFEKPDGVAIDASEADVKGRVLLGKGMNCTGAVRLTGSIVRDKVDCSRGSILCGDKVAFDGRRMRLEGDLDIQERACVEGCVDLRDASIAARLVLQQEERGRIVGLDLRGARVGVLVDNRNAWPPKGGLHLEGFAYRSIAAGAPDSGRLRADWLRRQPKSDFSLGPYQAMAAYFARRGRTAEALRIMFASARDRTRRARLSLWTQFWRGLAEMLFGYGYRPLMPLMWAVLLVLLGWLAFAAAGKTELMVRRQETGPLFDPLVYSVENLMPVLELGQGATWRVAQQGDADVPITEQVGLHLTAYGLRLFDRGQAIAGWLLAGSFVLGLVGWLMAMRRVGRLAQLRTELSP